jgi:hypothetical protein
MDRWIRARRLAVLAVGCFAIIVLVPGSLRAEKLLRWKFTKGDQRHLQRTEDVTVAITGVGQMTLNQSLVLGQLVEDVDDQGVATITQKFEQIKISMVGAPGVSFSYDSKSTEAPKGGAQQLAPLFKALMRAQFTSRVSPQGQILDVVAPEDLVQFAEQAKDFPILRDLYSKDGLTRTLKQSAAPFPELPVEKGDQWNDKDEEKEPKIGTPIVTTGYSYDGEEEAVGRLLDKISTSIKFEFVPGEDGQSPVTVIEQSSAGSLLFDAEAGQLVSGETSHHIKLEAVSEGKKTETDIKTKTDVKVTSEAP